jgi:hypothetical protein
VFYGLLLALSAVFCIEVAHAQWTTAENFSATTTVRSPLSVNSCLFRVKVSGCGSLPEYFWGVSKVEGKSSLAPQLKTNSSSYQRFTVNMSDEDISNLWQCGVIAMTDATMSGYQKFIEVKVKNKLRDVSFIVRRDRDSAGAKVEYTYDPMTDSSYMLGSIKIINLSKVKLEQLCPVQVSGAVSPVAGTNACGLCSTTEGFVTAVYKQVYRRDPDAGGLTYWVSQITSGSSSRERFLQLACSSPEYQGLVASTGTQAQPCTSGSVNCSCG